jgi:hypothetical protein
VFLSLCYKAHAGPETCRSHSSAAEEQAEIGQKSGMGTGVLCFRVFALSMACLLLAVLLLVAQDPSKLSLEYYSKTCPNVEHVVRTEMECVVCADTRNAALMLRLHFHDCFVQVSTLFLFTV